MSNIFAETAFKHGCIQIELHVTPVSLQASSARRAAYKANIRSITRLSDYIITDTCWISIEYYTKNILRKKNPSMFDLDNIIKPTLDALCGLEGILIDDSIVDRVSVNWIDSQEEDRVEILIEYPYMRYLLKAECVFLRSSSDWCFPCSKNVLGDSRVLGVFKENLVVWDSIKDEDEYYQFQPRLLQQGCIHYQKIRDSGFLIIEKY